MNEPGGLPIIRVWLQPEHLVSTAKLLLAGHRLPALGVVDLNRRLIGFATATSLQSAPDEAELASFLTHAGEAIHLRASVREAAKQIQESTEDFLPVVENGQFFGVISAKSLLGQLRQSFDPMTELPWSDALRDWGAEQLRHSNEIAVIFIDLNKFGAFNKQFGHVIGDKVLQGVVQALKGAINSSTDLLVRYGGDEFAIGTLRDRDEADSLVESLRKLGTDLVVPGVPAPINFSVGIHGGRRSKVRNDIHVQANLDNLVNLASQNCLASKSGIAFLADAPSPTPVAPLTNFPVVETIQADEDPNSLTYVVLRSENGLAVGTSLKMGRSVAESVAMATAKALEKAHPESSIQVDNLKVSKAGSTELVTIETTVVRDGFQRSVTAEVEANDDLTESVASAVISAFFAE
jgi:diguanylate cyclase (GGDEF)-like protein